MSGIYVPYGGEGGIRTLDGLLTRRKTLRNQQLTDSQRVAVPCIPLTSPSLAVGLAVDALWVCAHCGRRPTTPWPKKRGSL
jgi:hypothetical protein